MNRRCFLARLGSASAAGLAVGALMGCGGPGGTAMRFRLTVEISTPEGAKDGSTVIELRVFDNTKASWAPGEARNVRTEMRGEAIFIELGQSKHAIALLASGPTGQGSLNNIVEETFGWLRVSEYARYQQMTGARDVPLSIQPTLVTFTDLTDPASARVLYATGTRSSVVNGNQVVTGEVVIDRFSETFGAGYAFKRATIEMTTDPISKAIEKKLPTIIRKLDEDRKVFRTFRPNDPYLAQLGQFRIQ